MPYPHWPKTPVPLPLQLFYSAHLSLSVSELANLYLQLPSDRLELHVASLLLCLVGKVRSVFVSGSFQLGQSTIGSPVQYSPVQTPGFHLHLSN